MLLSTLLWMAPAVPASVITFENVTEQAGITFQHTIGDAAMSSLIESTGVGCAFLDFDRDGCLDVYLVNGAHLPGLSDPQTPEAEHLKTVSDRLYRNRGNGTFEDVTVKAGLLPGGYGIGVLVGDYDSDGDPDLYVTQFGPNRLYRNRGDGTFEEVAARAGVADARFSVGAVFLDYDRDGDLDLFVGNYVEYDDTYNRKHGKVNDFPGPLAFRAAPDQLYRNDGNGTFVNVTAAAGLNKPPGRAMGVRAFDFDDDGWPDIFVSNDAMENHFYRNRRNGTFQEDALMTGVALGGSGEATGAMAVECGDVNGDGRLDFYVPDFTASCLYLNTGRGYFEEGAVRSGIARAVRQHIKWGAALADYDLDGDLDLYVSMGDANSLAPYADHVLANDGRGRFQDVSTDAGAWFQEKHCGRGVAAGDFDNDGRVDLLVANLNNRPALLRNTTPANGRHWLMVRLLGRRSNRDGIGARITCKLEDRSLIREVTSAGSYCCSHDLHAHFGLGAVARIPKLIVRWPSGAVQKLNDVKADQVLIVQEPAKGQH